MATVFLRLIGQWIAQRVHHWLEHVTLVHLLLDGIWITIGVWALLMRVWDSGPLAWGLWGLLLLAVVAVEVWRRWLGQLQRLNRHTTVDTLYQQHVTNAPVVEDPRVFAYTVSDGALGVPAAPRVDQLSEPWPEISEEVTHHPDYPTGDLLTANLLDTGTLDHLKTTFPPRRRVDDGITEAQELAALTNAVELVYDRAATQAMVAAVTAPDLPEPSWQDLAEVAEWESGGHR